MEVKEFALIFYEVMLILEAELKDSEIIEREKFSDFAQEAAMSAFTKGFWHII